MRNFYKWEIFRKKFSAFQESGKLELFFKAVYFYLAMVNLPTSCF